MSDQLIECHCCGRHVEHVRSVKLRPFRWIDLPKDVSTWTAEQHRSFEQYLKDGVYRRAFICEICYKGMDAESNVGTASIRNRAGEWKAFSINGESRGDKAAIYNYAKWVRFQKKQAAAMGVEFTG